ncbi:1311_t:CDS:2, partial [Cetraspora pellucida]
ASTTTLPSINTSTALSSRYTLMTPPGNAFIALPSHYTFTTPPHNALPPLSQNIFKHFLDIYETKCVFMSLHEKYQKTKPKTTTSLEYGIIDLNDRIILKALRQSVISHFEAKMQEYKPKKALFTEVIRILKTFNVTSLEDLGKAFDDIKINYNNLNYDIIYLYHLFKKFNLVNKHVTSSFFNYGLRDSRRDNNVFENDKGCYQNVVLPFIQNLYKKYQTLLMKEADYYLDNNNT